MTKPPTRLEALTWLQQIMQQKWELPDAMADLVGMHGSWQIGGVHGSLAEDTPMPHGLDAAFDDVDSLGAPGIRTPDGVAEMLESLAIRASYLVAEKPASYPGPWLKIKLENDLYDWEAWDEWEDFCEELSQTRNIVARLSGHGSQTISLCPQCGGKITARMTENGREDTGKCADCTAEYDLWASDWDEQLIAKLRSPHVGSDVSVTMRQLKAIWPQLRAGTIRNWVYRGQVKKVGDTYRLADINRKAVLL